MWTYRVDQLKDTRWKRDSRHDATVFVVMEPGGRDNHYQKDQRTSQRYCEVENKRLALNKLALQ